MKQILSIVFCYCCLTACAWAQTEKEVSKQPVAYTRPVPSFATRTIPAEGQSLFWGKLTSKPNETTLGFHLHSLYARELKRERGAKCHLALDVFTLRPKPRLLNRIFLVYKYAWPPTTFGISFTWLKPKEQAIPVLVVRSFSKGIYGPLGIEHFVVFPNGWKNWASVTNLNFGSWHASDTAGQVNRLFLGKDDLLEVRAALSPTTSELSPEQVTRDYNFTLRWNWSLQNFAPHAENQTVIDRYFKPYQ